MRMTNAPIRMSHHHSNATFVILHSAFVMLALASCSLLPANKDTSIIYALGKRDDYSSPLLSSLKTACSALDFERESITLDAQHEPALKQLVSDWEKDPKSRFIIVAYCPPGIPEDHARSLTDRRALGVRQHLIELGLDGNNMQTLGLGNDFAPTSPATHVVVIYKQP